MIYLFDKDEKLFKIINKPALKTVLQKYALTTEQYVSDRLTVEMKSLDADELEKVEYMAIQTIEDAHTFHYFYVAQKHTDKLTTLIGVQSGIEELRKTPVWDKRPKNAFAKNVINDLLKGTNWQARFVGETTQRSTSFYYISVFEALKKVCKVWDLEMQFFVEMNGNKIGARYIDFKRKIGSAVGKRVVYGHNALQILQEVERTNLFTALIGRGKGEQVSSAEESDKKTDGYGRKITFENVVWDVAKGNPVNKPKGQRFVELPEMTKNYGIKNTDGSIRPKIGFVDFQEEEDPGVLLERTYKALVDAARPQLTLKTTSAYLRGVKVGDTIRVVRHDKKLDYDTRIFEITFNRLNNESSDIKLGDRIGESNEAKAQTIAEKVVDDFVSNEFSDFVQKLPDFLPSPDGFNNNWYGAEDPTVKYPGKVLINDIWFKPDPEHEGHKIMLRWTGEVWDEIVRSYDKESLTKRISEEIANFDKTFQSVNEQNKRKIDEILQSSGASSSLSQEAKRIGLESVAKLEEFKRQATSAQTALLGDLDTLKRTVASEVNQASEYRRTTTEALSRMTGQMEGFATKSEVAQGIDGLTQTFAKMKVGGRNLLRGSKGPFLPDRKPANFDNNILYVGNTSIYMEQGQEYIISAKTDGNFTAHHDGKKESDNVVLWIMDKDIRNYQIVSDLKTGTTGTKFIWDKPTGIYHLRVNTYHKEAVKSVWDVKIEKGNIATDWSPAIEDVESQITEARTEFKQTADGLSTKMAAVETYVGQDNQRQESLRRYTREESAKQATAIRELVARDYVGKATHQEDVRGIERRFEAITNQQNGLIATQIANYKKSVDGRFTEITSLISGKANQTDFQRVKETSQLYERILGSTDNGIANNVARMALTNQLFQVEVSKAAKGGRNYIRGIKEMRVGSGSWDSGTFRGSGSGSIRTIEVSDGPVSGFNKAVRIISSDPKGQIGVAQDGFEIMPGTYTMSVWIRGSAGQRVRLQNYWWSDDSTGISPEFILKDDKWTYLTFSSERKKAGKLSIGYVYLLNGAKGSYLDILAPQLEEGSIATSARPALEDTDEAIRTVQSQLFDSWAVQNLTSAGSIVSQINATNNQILIEAEKIRLKGKTLLDELTAIQGYFKRLFVGDASVGTLNSDIIRSNSITADKLVMDMAMARRFVSSDIFTDTLAAKEAFINKLRSVVVTATLLEGYKGRIGGFQIGTHEKDSSVYWITGQNQFSVGMSNGSGHWSQTALWVNWGNNWGSPGNSAWFVKNNGKMYCYNQAEFWNTPVVHGDLQVTGSIYYNNSGSGGKSGYWISSHKYTSIQPSDGTLYLYYSGSGYDWIPMNKEISDRRYKHNIEASTVSGLDVVKNLKTYSYRKKYDGKIEDIACGIMAQDVQKYAPEAFFENPDGAYSYNTFALVPYLIKAIQELNQKIEKLEKTA